ncbi:MAG: hypothetical protein WD597_13500, partial [Balneolaceae bacterium]
MRTYHKTGFRLFALLIVLLFCSTEIAYSQCNERSVILVNGRIIDGTGAEPQEGWDVKICGDEIVEIGPNLSFSSDDDRIDVEGLSLLPGLINMHGHLYANLGPPNGIRNRLSYLKLYLAGGVTTIYSPGEFDANNTINLQEKIKQGKEIGPDILTAGPYFDH